MKLKTITLLTAILLSSHSLVSQYASAGATTHNVPGVACGAYNNSQANNLTRDHVRIYLPASAQGPLWVVCPIQRVYEDITATTDAPNGYINAYFDQDAAAGTEVTCIIRHFHYSTIHFVGRPGNPPLEPVQTVMATKTANRGVSQTIDVDYALTNTQDFPWQYFTVACKLDPGTGINSIDMDQL